MTEKAKESHNKPQTRFEGHRKANYVRGVFDTIAEGYDFMNILMTGGLLKYWHRVFRSRTGLEPGDEALDVACGTGDLSLIMAGQVRAKGHVVGVDFSPQMLRVGRQKVAASHHAGVVDLQLGNALDLPFENDRFDCAAIGFALRNVTDIDQVLREMIRVVRPGGRVLSLEMSKPDNRIVAVPFWWYFRKVVPFLGRLVERSTAGDLPLPPYAWLPASLEGFPRKQELARRFEHAGLQSVEVVSFHGGVVALHVGTKS